MGLDDRFYQANNQKNTVNNFSTIGPVIVGKGDWIRLHAVAGSVWDRLKRDCLHWLPYSSSLNPFFRWEKNEETGCLKTVREKA